MRGRITLQVIEDIPCYTSVELLEKHNCDICAHGGMAMYCQLHSLEYYYYADDFAANADGVDSYATVKTAGKYRYKMPSTMYGPLIGFTVVREYKRTEGVSTTDLLRRYNCFF